MPITVLLWHDNWPMQNPRAIGGIFSFRSVLTTKESCRLEGPTLTTGGQTSGENDRQLETEAELCWDLSSHQGQIDQRQEVSDEFEGGFSPEYHRSWTLLRRIPG